jgi:hypothetical protein
MLGNCSSVLQLAELFCSVPREKHLMVTKLTSVVIEWFISFTKFRRTFKPADFHLSTSDCKLCSKINVEHFIFQPK